MVGELDFDTVRDFATAFLIGAAGIVLAGLVGVLLS